jgi:deazaflavin-dependent oxidoreductase (nitroreductase family)
MLPRAATIFCVALPHWLTRVNLAFGNAIMRPFASIMPWFAVLEHVGRTSGTVRQTAMMAFERGDGRWVIALTYGSDVQWVKNVLASDGCRIQTRRRWRRLGEPRRFADPSRRVVPWLVRPVLAVLRVDQFLELRERDMSVASHAARPPRTVSGL